MLKVNINIGTDLLDVEGDIQFADVLPLIKDWFAALNNADNEQLREISARLTKSTAVLSSAEAADAAGHPIR